MSVTCTLLCMIVVEILKVLPVKILLVFGIIHICSILSYTKIMFYLSLLG